MNSELQKKNPSSEVEKTHTNPTYLPKVDIYEDEKERKLVVVVDMPGAKEKDVSIGFEKGILNISAHVEPQIPEGHQLVYSEYKTADYQRTFSVPEEIDVEKIEASVKNGLVTVILPKSQKPQARKIPVKAS